MTSSIATSANQSEYGLFKLCVNNPLLIDKQLTKLNLTFVKDTLYTNSKQDTNNNTADKKAPTPVVEDDNSLECKQRKALRLYSMIWSGMSKMLLNCVDNHGRAVEIPGLAIFGPIMDTFQVRKDPLDKGPGRKQGLPREFGGCPVIAVINQDFIDMTNGAAQIDCRTDKAVGVFAKGERKELFELFGPNNLHALNTTSIGKVCLTDSYTIELMIAEFVAQAAKAIEAGSSLRINLKIGYLISRNGTLQFQQSQSFHSNNGTSAYAMDSSSVRTTSQTTLDQYSVMTPSMARQSDGRSTVKTKDHHMGNPNPQGQDNRFKGLREIGYYKAHASPQERIAMDMFKFGKRVVFDKGYSTSEVLEDHLAQMHQHLAANRNIRQARVDEEKEALQKLMKHMDQQDDLKHRTKACMKADFTDQNNELNQYKQHSKQMEKVNYQNSKLDYFPFVSGDILENHTKGLNHERFTDMRAYMQNKASTNKKLLGSGMGNTDGASISSSVFNKFSASQINMNREDNQSPRKQQFGSQVSQNSSNRLTRSVATTVAAVKPLFDSCYLQPHENPRVIQETGGAKGVAMDEAYNRHLKIKELEHGQRQQLLQQHYQRIDKSEQVAKQSQLVKKTMHQDTQDLLKEQMKEFVKEKDIEASHRKATSKLYGPSDVPEEINMRKEIKRQKNTEIKDNLINQISYNNMVKVVEKESAQKSDIYKNDENEATIIAKEQRYKQQREVQTKHWEKEVMQARKERDHEKMAIVTMNKTSTRA